MSVPPDDPDPDAEVLAERFPRLARIGETVKINLGPLAGEPTVMRRRLTERGGVLFTMRYDDGRVFEWEWFRPSGQSSAGMEGGSAAGVEARAASLVDQKLPVPPETLLFGEIILRFARLIFTDPQCGLVPYYHFRLLVADGVDAGHINFRVGDTEHVRNCVGHIGFAVTEAFRGHGYAWQACRALAPFVRSLYSAVIVTCDPDNVASRRTIEDLGALFMDEVAVPQHDPQDQYGSRLKRRYAWIP